VTSEPMGKIRIPIRKAENILKKGVPFSDLDSLI